MVCWSSWALPGPVNYVLGSNNQTVRLLVHRNVINEVRVAVLHQALQGNDNSFLSHTLEQNVAVIQDAALRVGWRSSTPGPPAIKKKRYPLKWLPLY